MFLKPQTAIRGIFSVGLINISARIIGYGKHIVITAMIGLSAQLDAFYMATTILAMGVLVFGDIFDSVGIPRLVKTLQSEGDEEFRNLAGTILSLALILALGLCLILAAIAPMTPWIAPGFSPEKRGLVLNNLLYLGPMALLFLPYHAMGSFLRAKRRFQAFYLGEIIIAGVTLVVILLWHDRPYALPVSFSVAYVFVFLYAVLIGRKDIRFFPAWDDERLMDFGRVLLRLLPVYLVFHLFTLSDRIFASYLPTGGVSALSYALIIALLPNSILMMENVFITPLSESPENNEMFRRIVEGVLIISVPIAVFTTFNADQIVGAAFERGVFTKGSTQLTGDALAYFAPAIPAYFLWPISYRRFQILGRLGGVTGVAYFAVFLNGVLNYLFMTLGMGIKGLALATSLANYGLIIGSLVLLRRNGIFVFSKSTLKVLSISVSVAVIGLWSTHLVPHNPSREIVGLICRGVIFLTVCVTLFFIVPDEHIRRWRDTVRTEIFPRKVVR